MYNTPTLLGSMAEAPTATGHDVIDAIAAAFRKVFSQIEEVMKIEVPPEVATGELSSCDAIRKALGGDS